MTASQDEKLELFCQQLQHFFLLEFSLIEKRQNDILPSRSETLKLQLNRLYFLFVVVEENKLFKLDLRYFSSLLPHNN